MTKEYTTAGEEQTEALGVRLGQLIQPGAVIAYTGDLGRGRPPLPGAWPGAWVSRTG